ncbi:VanZ family protein [Flavobacterium sp.]|uniref:VanZ family protein n=1 Tax=Flavobacterium sp. TaxID=239 RepID=UPI004047628A
MKITKHLSERKYFLLTIFWAILIAVLSLVSFKSIAKGIVSGNDKFFHFVFYAIFAILLRLSIRNKKMNFFIICIVVIYGIIIEILQGVLTTTRESDLFDALANTLGAIVGLKGLHYVKKQKN